MTSYFRFFLILCIQVLFFCSPRISAQEPNAGYVYGKDYVCSVKAPAGWVLDQRSGRADGLQAVFYPTGSSWTESAAVMYVNLASKDENPDPTLEKFIEEELNRFKEGSPNIKVKDIGRLKIGDGKEALIRELTGDNWGNTEAVAYLEEPTAFIIFVLNSRTIDTYQKSLLAFKDMVGSYKFISDSNYKDMMVDIAKKQTSTPAGKEYEGKFVSLFGRQHASTMKKCFEKTPNPDKSAFHVLINLDADGKILKILLKPETNIALCLKEHMMEDTYPTPPQPDWWIDIGMNIDK